MHGDINDMMGPASGSEELPVEHMGNPGERKRVLRVSGLKGPLNPGEAQAAAYVGIGDKDGIIVIDEIVVDGLAVNGKNYGEQQEIHPDAGTYLRKGRRLANGASIAAVFFGARHPGTVQANTAVR